MACAFRFLLCNIEMESVYIVASARPNHWQATPYCVSRLKVDTPAVTRVLEFAAVRLEPCNNVG